MSAIESQQVSWWPSHQCAAQWAAEHGIDLIDDDLPNPGTPRWCRLSDAHKLAALLLRASKAVLHDESEQQASAEASRAIAGAADWTKLSREINQRTDFYSARPWLKRVVA